ncbi:MAG: MFS transporter [Firmicutes bacterium]|nr:MFS transporter [Bacillota bacterium]
MRQRDLTFRNKISYGIGGICDNTLYTLTGTYLLLFLTTVAGVSPAVAGTISAVGSLWEALAGPYIGHRSDRTRSRFGKRRPFMMAASVPIAVMTSLLFMTVSFGPAVKAVYYLVVIVLFWTFFSMDFVPYMSLGADLTDDYHGRTVLRSYAYVFNQVGMLIGMVLPALIVSRAQDMGASPQKGWLLVGIVCGAAAGASALISALSVRTDDESNVQETGTEVQQKGGAAGEILKEYASLLKLKPMRFIVAISVIYLVANTFFSSDRVFFMTYNAGMSQDKVSLVMLVITLSGIAFVPFIEKISGKTDKTKVFMCGIGISGAAMMILRLFDMTSLAGIIAVCLLYSLANTCYWQLMPSMIYDITEVVERETGRSQTGAVISFQALSESISIAVGLQGLGLILGLAHFDEAAAFGAQPASALNWVSNCFTLIPGLFMVLVALVMLKYPINKKTMEELRKK